MIRRSRALAACAAVAAVLAAGALGACGVALEGGDAQAACSELNAAFCERLASCDPSVNETSCVDADDALGGACTTASRVELESEVATCTDAIDALDCEVIEDRTSPDFDLPCIVDISFEEP